MCSGSLRLTPFFPAWTHIRSIPKVMSKTLQSTHCSVKYQGVCPKGGNRELKGQQKLPKCLKRVKVLLNVRFHNVVFVLCFRSLSNGELIQQEMRDAIRNGNSITTLYCFQLNRAATVFAKPASKQKWFQIKTDVTVVH